MICTRCTGTGFLNLAQVDGDVLAQFENGADHRVVLDWIARQTDDHDVSVCDCCGDGDVWYGEPGQHYGPDDPPGPVGPYVSNGGLCKCN